MLSTGNPNCQCRRLLHPATFTGGGGGAPGRIAATACLPRLSENPGATNLGPNAARHPAITAATTEQIQLTSTHLDTMQQQRRGPRRAHGAHKASSGAPIRAQAMDEAMPCSDEDEQGPSVHLHSLVMNVHLIRSTTTGRYIRWVGTANAPSARGTAMARPRHAETTALQCTVIRPSSVVSKGSLVPRLRPLTDPEVPRPPHLHPTWGSGLPRAGTTITRQHSWLQLHGSHRGGPPTPPMEGAHGGGGAAGHTYQQRRQCGRSEPWVADCLATSAAHDTSDQHRPCVPDVCAEAEAGPAPSSLPRPADGASMQLPLRDSCRCRVTP